MSRAFPLVLLSVLLVTIACKKSETPAGTKTEEAKPADPAKADPAKAAEPAKADPAKPADPAPAAAGGGANSALENKGIAMMQKLGDVFANDAKDCDKLAVDLKAFLAENKALIKEMSELEKKQTEAEKAAFEARNKKVQEEVQGKMEPAAKACADNKNVQEAMRDFPTD
jgi:hypothetical protein